MVIINKNSMFYKSLYYVLLMVIFGVLAYLFLNSGFNTETKVVVSYEDNSDVSYKVNYIDNEYDDLYNNKYISSMVDDIDINFNYNNLLSEYVNGYYKYNVVGYLVAYEDDITNSLWKREYQLVDEKTFVIDSNKVNSIKILDNFNFDFKKYRDEIKQFINDSNIDVLGYMHIRINILEFLNFNDMENEYSDSKVITLNIPLTDDIFKINVNNLSDKDSYYEFSNKKAMNIVFLLIGAFCLALAISSLVMVFKQFIFIYDIQSKYKRDLNRILSKYDKSIIKVKKFYTKKKYNMIYVDSFNELMDVYYKKCKMISFKEVKRDFESIFVIIDGEDAWIYKLIAKKENKFSK